MLEKLRQNQLYAMSNGDLRLWPTSRSKSITGTLYKAIINMGTKGLDGLNLGKEKQRVEGWEHINCVEIHQRGRDFEYNYWDLGRSQTSYTPFDRSYIDPTWHNRPFSTPKYDTRFVPYQRGPVTSRTGPIMYHDTGHPMDQEPFGQLYVCWEAPCAWSEFGEKPMWPYVMWGKPPRPSDPSLAAAFSVHYCMHAS